MFNEGDPVHITPADGSEPYQATVRGVHEGGYTVLVGEEVRTVTAAEVGPGVLTDGEALTEAESA